MAKRLSLGAGVYEDTLGLGARTFHVPLCTSDGGEVLTFKFKAKRGDHNAQECQKRAQAFKRALSKLLRGAPGVRGQVGRRGGVTGTKPTDRPRMCFRGARVGNHGFGLKAHTWAFCGHENL